MLHQFVVAVSGLTLSCTLVRQQVKSRRISRATWGELISQLQPAEMSGIALVAIEYQNPCLSEFRNDASTRWKMIGGLSGLRHMRSNADVLIALAAHVENWGSPESRTAANAMRKQGLILRQASRWIGFGHMWGYGINLIASYVQVAASAYYAMTNQLLDLYKLSPSERSDALGRIVWQ